MFDYRRVLIQPLSFMIRPLKPPGIVHHIRGYHYRVLLINRKNMVTRILITLRFWPERLKTPHVLLFCKTAFSALDDETLEEPFFQLAGGCSRSFWHVVAIDPLVDSIPELSIYRRASVVLHLTGTRFLQVIPTTINLLGACNLQRDPQASIWHGTRTYNVIPKQVYNIHTRDMKPHMITPLTERYYPPPPPKDPRIRVTIHTGDMKPHMNMQKKWTPTGLCESVSPETCGKHW